MMCASSNCHAGQHLGHFQGFTLNEVQIPQLTWLVSGKVQVVQTVIDEFTKVLMILLHLLEDAAGSGHMALVHRHAIVVRLKLESRDAYSCLPEIPDLESHS